MPRITTPNDLAEVRSKRIAFLQRKRRCITVCSGTGCLATKSAACADSIAAEIARQGADEVVDLRRTGCYGFCERGPVVGVQPENICYLGVQAKDAAEVVTQALHGGAVERLLYQDADAKKIRTLNEIPFYKHQNRVLLDANTRIDPKSIEDYIAIGGYTALTMALGKMEPTKIIDIIKDANLRGRGGGGYPAGWKWDTTRNAPAEPKYVVVNGDEGDPGAYMDRSILEGNPHSVLEGLIIGAYAIGAHQGYFYVRQEYPLAVENVNIALKQAREYGLLGKDILGSGFDFDASVHCGAGAFVSGESSALMTAIEGRVGEPRPKYVHTSVVGLWDKPTNLNNVETWANVPLIIQRGSDWFKSMGTENSKGTKVFSLVGKVLNSGLVEVPMGMTLRDIVYRIGGGVREGKKLKAVQTGGPSGGYLPERLLDTPVDFDELTKAGSMMGSGGMIVMDEDGCIVDTTRYYVDFLAHESCGQCIPCREGLRQMSKVFNRIVAGKGEKGDIELLTELSEFLSEASLCALGKSAPNPVLSAITYFRDEFEAHVNEKRCPALVCRDLIHYVIDPEKCVGCPICKKECPTNAISGVAKSPHVIEYAKCVKCGNCLQVCPKKIRAVRKAPGSPPQPSKQGARITA